MATCGLWLSRATLWSSVADDDGKRIISFPVARTDEARCAFLAHLHATQGLDCTLVMTDAQARLDTVANLALQQGMLVCLAPWRTVHALRTVAGLATGPPKRTALLLARMPLHPLWCALLRRPERNPRQLSML